MPGLGKQWLRSGKVHSRWSHDLTNGQVGDADKPFLVPNPSGGIDKMQRLHDPKAPVEQVLNCGRVALPYLKSWAVAAPWAKPFSELELQLDRRKAQLDQDAQRAGRRREGNGPGTDGGLERIKPSSIGHPAQISEEGPRRSI